VPFPHFSSFLRIVWLAGLRNAIIRWNLGSGRFYAPHNKCQIDGVLARGQSVGELNRHSRFSWPGPAFATTVATTQYYNTELSGGAREPTSDSIKQLQPPLFPQIPVCNVSDSYPYRLRVVCFHREETLAEVTEKGPLRLCCRGGWDHPGSGKNQGKLRTNQPQLTLAQDDRRKRKFRVPRFVAGNQAVSCVSSGVPPIALVIG